MSYQHWYYVYLGITFSFFKILCFSPIWDTKNAWVWISLFSKTGGGVGVQKCKNCTWWIVCLYRNIYIFSKSGSGAQTFKKCNLINRPSIFNKNIYLSVFFYLSVNVLTSVTEWHLNHQHWYYWYLGITFSFFRILYFFPNMRNKKGMSLDEIVFQVW